VPVGFEAKFSIEFESKDVAGNYRSSREELV